MRNCRTDMMCVPSCVSGAGAGREPHPLLTNVWGRIMRHINLDILTGILITISSRSLLKLTQRHTWTWRQPAHDVST